MNYSEFQDRPMHIVWRVLCCIAICICLFLGVIGIVLPIIPGLLFLAIAAYLATKMSKRFASAFDENDRVKRMKRKWRSTGGLSMNQRVKLSFWVAAKSVVDSIKSGLDSFTKK